MAENTNQDDDYLKRYKRYSKLSDEELIDLYLKDANNPGWTRSRMNHAAALSRLFEERSIDIQKLKKPRENNP